MPAERETKTVLRAEKRNVKSLWEAFTTDRQNLPRTSSIPETKYQLSFGFPPSQQCCRISSKDSTSGRQLLAASISSRGSRSLI